MAKTNARVLINGRVQGVWFRAYTKEQADLLGLTGYVRNLPTGQVEAVFAGPQEMVEKALAWCREGSPAAKVDEVKVAWEEPQERYKQFSIRY